jgi:hypothetical protein
MRSSAAVIAALVALGSLAACGSDDDDSAATVGPVATDGADATTPPASTPASGAPTTPGSPGSDASVPGTLPPGGSDVERAIADAARRSGVDPGDVDVVSDDEVTWRDSSAGCPQKGMQYLQVITDGRRIVLVVGARRFEYHSGGSRDLFFCADPQPPLEG